MNNNELIEYDKRTIINDFRNILYDGQNTLYNQDLHTRNTQCYYLKMLSKYMDENNIKYYTMCIICI